MRKLTDLFSLAAILGLPVLLAMTVPMLAVPQAAQAAGDPPGKAVFMAQKCNMCHSVPSAQIEKTTKSEKMAGPDLMPAGMEKDAIMSFLKKETKDANGKLHGKEFTGTAEELGTVADWLLANKKPA